MRCVWEKLLFVLLYIERARSLTSTCWCDQSRKTFLYGESSSRIFHSQNTGHSSRRSWIAQGIKTTIGSAFLVETCYVNRANADEEEDFFQDPEIKELYENPAIPQAPEEKSGLVV